MKPRSGKAAAGFPIGGGLAPDPSKTDHLMGIMPGPQVLRVSAACDPAPTGGTRKLTVASDLSAEANVTGWVDLPCVTHPP